MKEDIKKAIEVLKNGGVILYPTDTIWGLGCDATNPDAVNKIYSIKQRQESKAMLVLMSSSIDLERYVDNIPEIAYDLIDVSIKPLTIIYDNAIGLAPNLIASDGSIGIRITKENFSSELCKHYKKPIVSTSANISGSYAPSSFKDINNEIIQSVDYVIKYRQNDDINSSPSSIIKLSQNGVIKIIRP